MKVLFVGSGGREHTLVWKIIQSLRVSKIFAAPGNAGIAMMDKTECVDIDAEDINALRAFALKNKIDLTVVGPEAPLCAGIADRFKEKGLRIFGFDARTSELEGSKISAKEFMTAHKIPTAPYMVFDNPEAAFDNVSHFGKGPYVLKADGLAKGKGVIIAQNDVEAFRAIERIMIKLEFGEAGLRILMEDYLDGEEVSILAVFDGKTYRLFVPSQDHKKVGKGDTGDNTGGMGAYAPVPFIKREVMAEIEKRIIIPTFQGMIKEGMTGAGVLYFGIIFTKEGPKVLEYNVRFGDPETQVILPLFESDLFEVMMAATDQKLASVPFINSSQHAACVVVASGGYPDAYEKGFPIYGIEEAERRRCLVIHAGTTITGGKLVSNGGRVLGVVSVEPDLIKAIRRAERGASCIGFKNSFYRPDIGHRVLTGK